MMLEAVHPMDDNPQQNNGKSSLRRLMSMVAGVPLLAFGLLILLGAVYRVVTDSFTLPASSYLAAIAFGGVLPVATGLFLIIKILKKRT